MSFFLWRGRLLPIGPPSNSAGTTSGSWFLATVFRRDRASFGMRSTPRGRRCRMRRLYPAGLKRPKDEEYRQSNHRPSYQHGNPVQHRDITRRICAWDESANAATAVKRPEKIAFAEMRSARADWRPGLSLRCSHSVSLNADRWGDEVRLSDIEGQFFCQACGHRVPTRET